MIGNLSGNMIPIYWLILFVILLIIEIITLGLTTIWFAGGALIACAAAFLGAGVPIQCAVFLVVSVALLLLTRPYAMKHFNQVRTKTNAQALIGDEAVVIEEINDVHGTGRVRVHGMEWAAKYEAPKESGAPGGDAQDENHCMIHKDEVVIITDIQGVKLIVTKKQT